LNIGLIDVHFYFFWHFISWDKMTHIGFIGDLFWLVKFEVYKFRALYIEIVREYPSESSKKRSNYRLEKKDNLQVAQR
jgi:hypothetical protein